MSNMFGYNNITCIKHGAKKIKAEHLAFVEACKLEASFSVSVLNISDITCT